MYKYLKRNHLPALHTYKNNLAKLLCDSNIPNAQRKVSEQHLRFEFEQKYIYTANIAVADWHCSCGFCLPTIRTPSSAWLANNGTCVNVQNVGQTRLKPFPKLNTAIQKQARSRPFIE